MEDDDLCARLLETADTLGIDSRTYVIREAAAEIKMLRAALKSQQEAAECDRE